jgi:hypothetical protein
MRRQLTRIEMLDAQYPGLEDDVRRWFTEGLTTAKVAERIREKYGISLPARTVGGFRSTRWAPAQRLLVEKKVEAQAAHEVALERAIKQSLARQAPGETQ